MGSRLRHSASCFSENALGLSEELHSFNSFLISDSTSTASRLPCNSQRIVAISRVPNSYGLGNSVWLYRVHMESPRLKGVENRRTASSLDNMHVSVYWFN